tara:strand:- start:4 stop:378 length:375 start_codon:yes stop_codon:yes gene_type:complete
MENNKRTQRTPQEMIAETEARLERLRLRAAKTEAKSNPAIASLMDSKDELMKTIRESKKLLGDGPQSAQARILKHEVWIERIQDEVLLAETDLFTAESKLSDINAEIATAIEVFAVSKEISAEA